MRDTFLRQEALITFIQALGACIPGLWALLTRVLPLKDLCMFCAVWQLLGSRVLVHSFSGGVCPAIILQCLCLSLCLGSCEEQKLVPDGLEHKKPKQTKSPGQAYVGLPLCKDSQREDSLEAESREEGPSKGSPVNSVGAPFLKKKTESALCECGVLLASMALGLDVRKLHGAQVPTKPSPKDEKKGEGAVQLVSRCQTSSSPLLRQPSAGRAPSDGSTLLLSATSLLSKSSLSMKCLLQAGEEEAPLGNTQVSCGPTTITPDPSSAAPESTLTPGLRLKADCGVLRSVPPAILEQTGERLPGCSTAGDKECHRVQMGSNEIPLRPQSRW